jgi:poly(3-hydroxyalkanoate) synthetase
MIPSRAVYVFVIPFNVTSAVPFRTERYSVCVACQWRPDVQLEAGGRVMVVEPEVERSYVTDLGRSNVVRWVVEVRDIVWSGMS